MKQAISKILLKLAGWKAASIEGVEIPKCVICVAPHTSNWDFIIGKLFYTSIGLTAGFLMKKSWFFFPFNLIFKSMGGIPVERSKHSSMTRKHTEEWKRGFYYIALKAEVPILLAYIDYGKKEAGMMGVFHPTGDADKDIAEIRKYYTRITARHPENFAS